MILSRDLVRTYAYNAGFRGAALDAAVDIAKCESSYDTNAHNTSGEGSMGLWQINVSSNANPQYASYDLFDPRVNANVAFEIYTRAGNTFRDWTCATILDLINPQTISISTVALVGIILLYLLNDDI